MTKSKRKTETWSKMLIGAIVGALLTGSTQYILNERQFAQRIEATRVEIVRKYLESELAHRREKYSEIRRKLFVALETEEPQAIENAKLALETDLPFFEARHESQMPIQMTAKELLTYYFQTNPGISKEQALLLLEQLKRDFQNDLNRIQGELYDLGSNHSEKPSHLESSMQKAQQSAAPDAAKPRR